MEKLVNPNMTVHAMGLGPVWEHLYASQALDAPIKVKQLSSQFCQVILSATNENYPRT